MTEWLDCLRDLAADAPVAMVSVLATEGSVPRGAGTRMLVTAERLIGTIGGGALEFRSIEQARAMLAQPPGTWRVQDYPLGPLLGQCCGGRVRLLIERVDPAALDWIAQVDNGALLVSTLEADRVERNVTQRAATFAVSARGDRPGVGATFAEYLGRNQRPLYLFGVGHVGQAIARHARNLPFQLAWFDTRPECSGLDGATVIDDAAIEQCVTQAPDDAAVVILTHDHGLDYRLAKAALQRAPLAFIGMIGSQTKRARFHARLERDGIPAEVRARLTCPIGVAGVVGKEPDVIAVATCAQLLQLRQP